MYSLKRNHNHYVLQPAVSVAIDLGRAGIHSIPLNNKSNPDRLAQRFSIDHKLNDEAKRAIAELLRVKIMALEIAREDQLNNKENQPLHTEQMITRTDREMSYSKFKERLTTGKDDKQLTERKSHTPAKSQVRRNVHASTCEESRASSSKPLVRTVDLSKKELDRRLNDLFDALNKHNRAKNRLNVDCISFEGLEQETMESLHRFFSQLTEQEIGSLTRESFKTLARKHALVGSLTSRGY